MHTNASDIARQAQLYRHPRIHFPSDTPTRATSDKPCEHDRQNVTISPSRRAIGQTAWNDDNDRWPSSLQAAMQVLRVTSIAATAPALPNAVKLYTSLHPAPKTHALTLRDLEDFAWHQWEQRAAIQGTENANIPIMVELLSRSERAANPRCTLIYRSNTARDMGL